jgi:putative RNA 2'-phosphotransferase
MARDKKHDRRVRISKYLSLHLRHQPEALGLELGPGGWVSVAALLAGAANKGFVISREELDEVVATSDKQRYSFDAAGTQIRANQGHSIPVDLQLEPVEPPEILYHGTATNSVAAILAKGLEKMSRHHVHLSADIPTAISVGKRHGSPIVLEVLAGAMHRDGHIFFRSANGVWLADSVPAQYLRVIA